MTERQCTLCVHLFSDCRPDGQKCFYCAGRAREQKTDIHKVPIDGMTENECPALQDFYKRLRKPELKRVNFEQYTAKSQYGTTNNVAMFLKEYEHILWYARYFALYHAVGEEVDFDTRCRIDKRYAKELKKEGL